MSKRKGLTRAQHQAIGAELSRANASIQAALIAAVNAYGPGNKRARRIERRAHTAMRALLAARSELEELLAEHHSDWQVSDYFGEPPATPLSGIVAALRDHD